MFGKGGFEKGHQQTTNDLKVQFFAPFVLTSICVSSSSSSTKTAPLNINKVSSSLLSFGRKLIAPAMSGGSGGFSPNNTEVYSSSSSSCTSPASAPAPAQPHPLAEPPSGHTPAQTQSHAQVQHHRLLKSESMPVHLSKGEQQNVHGLRLVSGLPSGTSLLILWENWRISCMNIFNISRNY